ncbi:hypothetical protein MASR2M15_23950 [Anaerolineales bacterium]
MSQQSEFENEDSFLVNYARSWAHELGQESLDWDILLNASKGILSVWGIGLVLLSLASLLWLLIRPHWVRPTLLLLLLSFVGLIFIIPIILSDFLRPLILFLTTLLVILLMIAPGKMNRIIGFCVVMSLIFVSWETSKALAESFDYKILLQQANWQYETYESLDKSLEALSNQEIEALIFDRRDLSEIMLPYPASDGAPEDNKYPELRYLSKLDPSDYVLFMPESPAFPRRLSVAVRLEDAEKWASIAEIKDAKLGAVAGDFAEERYLSQPQNLVLLDLSILNDVNLPHLQTIAESFLQPARRNGSLLLVRILADAGAYTWSEAFMGFLMGAFLGFVLGAFFAHFSLMERALLPYVVASQTIPILAIAPMVVIWLGASQFSVAVIAAYLTFFPVTINTLRGLKSPSASEIDLMHSYAASKWLIMWKLRFPSALPYIFTALKVSATACVVGAIIGELPSGIGNGLGRAILDFSSDYSLISTPKLWASIVMAASIGIIFFIAVSLLEHLILRRYIRN